ncbi:hypothetical protein MMPV_004973 [Pyropia vietnamensis]
MSRVGVLAGQLRPRLALVSGCRAAAPATMAHSDGGGGSGRGSGGGGGSAQDVAAPTASPVLPPHLSALPLDTAIDLTTGILFSWIHPTFRPDGRFYGLAGEWGSFGTHDEPRGYISAPTGTLTRSVRYRGARVWGRPPAAHATDLIHINLSSIEVGFREPGTLRDADGLYEKRWTRPFPDDPATVLTQHVPGARGVIFAGNGGGLFGFPGGLAATKADGNGQLLFFELYLRADAAAGWSVVVMWPSGDGDGAPHPALLSLIREARVDGWEPMGGSAITLPPVSPASPAVPVDEWVGGYPGPTEADAGAGIATVTAVADGSDGRRLRSWTVTDGVRWTPVGMDQVGDGAGTRRVVALEDGLYLSVMADARAGGVLEFGSAAPMRAGQARQRLLVVLEPGAVVNRVVHEVYPPTKGDATA